MPDAIDKLTHEIIGAAIKVHKALGPGLFEEVYKHCMQRELIKRRIAIDVEVPLPVIFDGESLDFSYRLDLLVNNEIIVELKAVTLLSPVHKVQLLTYLRLAKKRMGLLINFNVPVLREGVIRMVNNPS